MKQICELKYDEAIKAIDGTSQVYFRRGVWNSYKLIDTASAIVGIKQSGYGADVRFNEEDGMYYVSCPVNSDMW